jgi:DNA polymerase III epsilon subunit-like protein
MSKPYLYFDTETTDLIERELVQLAFIDEGNLKFDMLFKPHTPISFKAMSIHNITPEMVADAPTFQDAKVDKKWKNEKFTGESVSDYLKFLSNEYIWVAHNADFDLSVLSKIDIDIPEVICSYKVARKYLTTDDSQDLESYGLQFLRYYLGLYQNENSTHNTAHDALSDVYFLRDLFEYLTAELKISPEEMIGISKDPVYMRSIPFGKYRGVSIKDLAHSDQGYLEWVTLNIHDKPDLIWNINRVLNREDI